MVCPMFSIVLIIFVEGLGFYKLQSHAHCTLGFSHSSVRFLPFPATSVNLHAFSGQDQKTDTVPLSLR